jgi:hypothetical protein
MDQITYKRMYLLLYEYRFGTMGFLDWLARFEQILHRESPRTALRER